MTTVSTRTRRLRMIEAFDAPQVEGPIRLFDEQELLFTSPPPVGIAAGAIGPAPVTGYALVTNDGVNYSVRSVPEAAGWSAIGRAGGYTALAGDFANGLYRNCDATFTTWQKIYTFPNAIVGNCNDIETNPDTGRILCGWGDFAAYGTLYYSDDNGNSWTEVTGLGGLAGGLRSFKYDPRTKVWYGVGRRGGAVHAIRSFDDGLTWEPIPNLPSPTQPFLDVVVDTVHNSVVLMPDNGVGIVTFDDCETWQVSAFPGRPFNLAFSPELGRIVAETTANDFIWSDDGGLTGTIVPFPFAFGHDINDICWLDNVDNPCFLAVGRTDGGGVQGWAAYSPNGEAGTWTLVAGPSTAFGLFLCSPLSPTQPPRDNRLTLPTERYSQIQHWRMTNALDPVEIVQEDRNVRVRGKGLINSDRSLSTLLDRPAPGTDIINTKMQLDDDEIGGPGHWWPRSRICRINGGYIQVHGDVGRVSRYLKYRGEILGERCRT